MLQGLEYEGFTNTVQGCFPTLINRLKVIKAQQLHCLRELGLSDEKGYIPRNGGHAQKWLKRALAAGKDV